MFLKFISSFLSPQKNYFQNGYLEIYIYTHTYTHTHTQMHTYILWKQLFDTEMKDYCWTVYTLDARSFSNYLRQTWYFKHIESKGNLSEVTKSLYLRKVNRCTSLQNIQLHSNDSIFHIPLSMINVVSKGMLSIYFF